jgi:SAM-dependent methyltransferase
MNETHDDGRLHFPAAERNREPILDVLRRVLPARGVVLEVASGSGQHAVHFGRALPGIQWQPSDLEDERLRSIDAWRAAEGVANVRAAVRLDVLQWPWPVTRADAVVNVNMVHIAPREVGRALFAGAGRVLGPGGVLCMYGPFRVDGVHTAPSNAEFEAWLRAKDERFGIWDVSEAAEAAAAEGFGAPERVEMPANNQVLVFTRG